MADIYSFNTYKLMSVKIQIFFLQIKINNCKMNELIFRYLRLRRVKERIPKTSVALDVVCNFSFLMNNFCIFLKKV
jgi:hypothetical protein